MIHIIISGHGDISTGILSASNMIFGEQEHVVAIPFENDEGLEDLQSKYSDAIKNVPSTDEVLFLVDVFGGTPYNAASQMIYQFENMDMVTGVNLPILLETLNMRESQSISSLVVSLKETSIESFKVFKEELIKIKETTESLEDDEI